MPLNLTPEYFEADRKYRQAGSPAEKLAGLQEMLSTIPKHKGTEKKQADIKRRISELKQEMAAPKKRGAAVIDPYHIVPQGAGQVMLLGLPNSGKSSIVGKLTKASVKITDYPYGTPFPVPGMAYYQDAPIELVDLPPVTPEHVPGNMVNALRNTDIVMLIIDLTSNSVLEDAETLLDILNQKEINIAAEDGNEESEDMKVGPEGFIVCTKADAPGAADTFTALQELCTAAPDMLKISAHTGEGLDEMMKTLFEMLDVIRIYSKPPGKPADMEQPFVLPAGSTIGELARAIHKDVETNLKYARIWGEQVFDGQQVHGQHILHDRDIVEIHV
ncbi:MAG: TGS domain-containing protein [Planctomycetota bacterium]|nr:MAG: TGS domain-containing protein [Planctomycetota bacterium]